MLSLTTAIDAPKLARLTRQPTVYQHCIDDDDRDIERSVAAFASLVVGPKLAINLYGSQMQVAANLFGRPADASKPV